MPPNSSSASLLNKTLLGRYALVIGSNEEATRLSGVNIKMRKTLICMTAGIFMAAGAIIFSARTGVAQPAEGWIVELPDEVATAIENRTDRTWPATWFVPNLTGEGPFTSVYDAMNAWSQPRCDQLRPHRGPPHHAGLHDAHPRQHVQRSHRTGLPAEELARLRHRRPGGRGLLRLRPVRPAVRLSCAFPVRESPREPGARRFPREDAHTATRVALSTLTFFQSQLFRRVP